MNGKLKLYSILTKHALNFKVGDGIFILHYWSKYIRYNTIYHTKCLVNHDYNWPDNFVKRKLIFLIDCASYFRSDFEYESRMDLFFMYLYACIVIE